MVSYPASLSGDDKIMIDQLTLPDHEQQKRMNDLEKLVGELSHRVALLQNQINNIKVDMERERI